MGKRVVCAGFWGMMAANQVVAGFGRIDDHFQREGSRAAGVPGI